MTNREPQPCPAPIYMACYAGPGFGFRLGHLHVFFFSLVLEMEDCKGRFELGLVHDINASFFRFLVS